MLSRRRCVQALVFIGVELGLRSVPSLMATLTVSPNPAPPSTLVAVAGAGFQNAKTRLLLDGVGATTNIFRPRKDGTFNVGITVASTAKTQTLVAQQLSGTTWTEKAMSSITVLIAAGGGGGGGGGGYTPPPENVLTLGSSTTLAQFMTALANEAYDVIELAAGTYLWSYQIVNIDRVRPVIVRPVAGATVIFGGTALGNTTIGGNPQFGFGFSGVAGNITFRGLIFDGYILNQQGIIQAANAHDMTFDQLTFRNSRCNGVYSQPYHAWCFYLQQDGSAVVSHFVVSNTTLDVADYRQMGFATVGGGANISFTGITVSRAFWVFHASARTVTGLLLDDWTIDDSGASNSGWGVSLIAIGFQYASGTYRNLHATSSGVLIDSSGTMTNGGGNTGI